MCWQKPIDFYCLFHSEVDTSVHYSRYCEANCFPCAVPVAVLAARVELVLHVQCFESLSTALVPPLFQARLSITQTTPFVFPLAETVGVPPEKADLLTL